MMIGKTTLKYITRVDNDSYRWSVRIGYNLGKDRVQKTFSDSKYGGSVKAYQAAKKWRDEQLKRLQPLLDKDLDANGQRHWGDGVNELWSSPKGGYQYLNICATYWCSRRQKRFNKTFSVSKYGYDEAVALAKQWRKQKLAGKL